MAGRMGMQTVQALLDEALVGLRAVADPALPVRQAEEQLSLALRQAYALLAARLDAGVWREGFKTMAAHVHSAATLLAGVPTEDPGGLAELGLIQQAMQALLGAARAPLPLANTTREREALPAPREPLRASLREPRLLDPEREVLLPTVPLPALPEPEAPPPPAPEPAPPVTTPAQLDALLAAAQARLESFEAAGEEEEAGKPSLEESRALSTDDEAQQYHFGTRREEAEVILGHARACLEDLGMFGLLRRARPGLTWWHGERTERRLVRRVDALAACGAQVLPRMVKLLEERPEPDPELTWANLFLFGSLAGQDALDQAFRIIRTVDLEVPAMGEGVADALALAPHPGIEQAVRPWLEDALAVKRAIGLRVLGRRGALQVAEASRALGDPSLEVVRVAAWGLGVAQGETPHRALAQALRHEDEQVVRAALESALLRRSETGLERAGELTAQGRGGFAEAALFLAVASGPEGAELLRAALTPEVHPTVLRALGWFGNVGFVESLVKYLESEAPGIKPAALDALQRLTGASLTKDRPDPEYEREAQPFLRPFEPPVPVLDLTDEAPTWAAWWKKHGHLAKGGTRYRFGHAWSPRTSLWELECQDTLGSERRLAHVELAVRTGGSIPLDREDFIARQLTQLEAWKAHVEAGARRHKTEVGWSTRYAR